MNKITIHSRNSPLAMWQTNAVYDALQQHHPKLNIEIESRKTQGDKQQQVALQEIGGKDLFASDLRAQLQMGHIAVHSLKDLSAQPQPGLTLAACLPRGSAADALITRPEYPCLKDLPKNAVIGTASPRRMSQLLTQRPDLKHKLIRGNVETRLNKLKNNEYDAILLACCGLERLQLDHHISERLPIETFIPAIGQGAIAIECLSDDSATLDIVAKINCATTKLCVDAERAVNQYLGGNCFTPIAAHATLTDQTLNLSAFVGSLDGKTVLYETQQGPATNPVELGLAVGTALEKKGAGKLLNPTD